jgi:hypothetical protein
MELAADFFPLTSLSTEENYMDNIIGHQATFSHLPPLKGADRINEHVVAVYNPATGRYKGAPIEISDKLMDMCHAADDVLKKADNYTKGYGNLYTDIYATKGASRMGHMRARDLDSRSAMKDPGSMLARAYRNQGFSCQSMAMLVFGLVCREKPGYPQGMAYERTGNALPKHAIPYFGDHREGPVIFMDKQARHAVPHVSTISKYRGGMTYENFRVNFDPGLSLVSTETLNKYATSKGYPEIDLSDNSDRALVKAIYLEEANRIGNGEERQLFEINFRVDFPDTTYVSPNHPEPVAFNRMPVETYEHRERLQDETAAFIESHADLNVLGYTKDGVGS